VHQLDCGLDVAGVKGSVGGPQGFDLIVPQSRMAGEIPELVASLLKR
jgi:hypothetical protein